MVSIMREIMCFGDSNTYGYIPGGEGRYPWEVRWTGILADRLYQEGIRVTEEGLCGRTTVFEDELRDNRKGSNLLPALLESHKPLDTVIIMLGTNDCKTYYHAPAEVIGKGIEKLIRQVRQADESIKILLISPILLGEEVWKPQFDPEFDTESVNTSKKLKAVYQKIAIEQGTDFLAASDYAKPSPIDQEHLDEEGHRRLAEAVYHKLAKMQLGTGAA